MTPSGRGADQLRALLAASADVLPKPFGTVASKPAAAKWRAYEATVTVAHDELPVKGHFAPDGGMEERIFRLTVQPLRNAVGVIDSVLLFAFDVTAHVDARRAIEAHEAERSALLASEIAARAAAEPASEAKDSFLATVSHELRTPLNAILG